MLINPSFFLDMDWFILLFLFWKVKNKPVRIGLITLAAILFFTNPIRHKQEGGTKLEIMTETQFTVPPRISVPETTFKKKQEIEMQNLKYDSENLKDEIHN